MTATKLSLNQNLVTGSYVKYRIKRSWAMMLLCFIAMFFCTVVPFLVSADYYAERLATQSGERFILSMTSYFEDNMIWCVIISGLLAVAAGCSSLSYLHNKVSAGFFHAIPEKRSGHFIASLVSAVVDFTMPFLANMLILTLAVAVNGMLFKFVAVLLLKMTLLGLFAYLVILSVCYLAGMLTGTGAIHVIFTFYILFILPVTVFSAAWWIGEGTSYLRFDAFEYVFERFILLSPVIRLGHVLTLAFSDVVYSVGIAALVIDLILTPCTFFGAYWLYCKRPIECTGTPVIYRKLSELVKYSVMLPMSFLGAIIFYEMGDGGAWLIFGFAMGIILTFMLMNTVLNRTTKAMFSGLKGLGIFTVCAIALFVTACTAVFGTLDYVVPRAESITVSIDGKEITITDKEYIEEFRREMKEFNKALKDDCDSVIYNEHLEYYKSTSVEYTDSDYHDEQYNGDDIEAILKKNVRTSSFSVYYKDAFGADTRFNYNNVHLTALSDIKALVSGASDGETFKNMDITNENFNITVSLYFYVSRDCVLDVIKSDEYLNSKLSYISNMYEYTEHDYNYCLITAEYDASRRLSAVEKEISAEKYAEFMEYMAEKTADVSTKPSIGNMGVSVFDGDKYLYESYPLCFDDIDDICEVLGEDSVFTCSYVNLAIPNAISQNQENIDLSSFPTVIPLIFEEYPSDYVNKFADDVTRVFVYDRYENTITELDEKSEIKDVLSRAAQISSVGNISPFTPTDLRYVIYVETEDANDSYVTYLFEK